MERPYVLLSCAMSVDGYIDDASGIRLLLSGAADLDRVDEVRSSCDAILVGAGTIRADDPRLVLRSQARRQARAARGASPDPVKVTLSGSGNLDPEAQFFRVGESARLVYVTEEASAAASARLAGAAEIVAAGQRRVDLPRVLSDLSARGIGRLMVEGGSCVHTEFLAAGLADELHLVIAPVFVGDSRAPRFAGDARYPWDAGHPARLAELRRVGEDLLAVYALSGRYGQC